MTSLSVKKIIDQMGECVTFSFPPKRIISLVPSQTELLYDLSLHTEVVGITKFCIHPQLWHSSKTLIGGTKNFNFKVIDDLQPDLIIGNKEENYKEGIDILKRKYPVWMSDIVTLNDALTMIRSIGDITNCTTQADVIIDQIKTSFSGLQVTKPAKVIYLIWKKPWMAAGNETFINALLEKIGFSNALKEQTRYPTLLEEEIKLLKPDYIFLSSEPYPFKEKHIEELKSISPSSQVIPVDGEMFSWYGSRLIKAPNYFNELLNSIRMKNSMA